MTAKSNDDTAQESTYTIGAVARLTGLSTQLIRVWEQRYAAVVAERSANGRRVYSTTDVEKLGLLKALTERGIAISTIAGLSLTDLRARVQEADQVALRPLPGKVSVAALGTLLPSVICDEIVPANPVELTLAGSDAEAFMVEGRSLQPDVLVLELTNLGPNSLDHLVKLREALQPKATLVAYRFARGEDEKMLARNGFRLLRLPLAPDGLAVSILAAAVDLRAGQHYQPPAETSPVPRELPAPPPKRFSETQLLKLARIESAVDCECPHHMAQVVQTLAAFELYSAQCENRNDDDAELHAYLHRATAQARAGMEEALAHLVAVEGLSLD